MWILGESLLEYNFRYMFTLLIHIKGKVGIIGEASNSKLALKA